MAAPREYESVTVTVLREDGTTRKKYEHPVSVRLDYDPHGLSCKLRTGSRVLVDIPIDTKTECCRVGVKSYLFASPEEDLLLTFQGDSDARKFHNHIFKMRQGKEVSVFNERTDESSATQYFQFYSYLSQQQNMMQDYIRTGTYQRAILSNLADFKDKVVLDVGAGSGILSFFAAQAGARRVYAVEASSMAQHAESLVRNNNLQNTIKVIAGKIEEIDINENVDMIISEPMGYMLYNERMLETYIHAKKWLNPNGKMFPSRGDLHVAPFSDETLYAEQLTKANFWYQAYFHGVDLSSLREQALKEYFRQPIVDTFDINICLAKSIRHTLDFLQAKEKDLHNIHIPLEFHILKSATVHGLAFWFDVAFLGSKQAIWLSTAPTEPLTHWYQVRCLLERPIFVKEGQLLRGTVDLIANRRQSYDVKMELRVEGTDTMSTNTLDLKNPYFRYTGIAPQPPPGQNTTSPSEDYWAQLDVQGAKEAVNMVNGITVNGLGEVAIEPENSLIHLGGTGLQLASAAAVAAAVHPGNLASTGTTGLALQNFNLPTQPAASTTHHSFQTQSSNLGPGRGSGNVSNNFPVNNALMIGDYVTPGSIILPTQGIQLPSNFTSHQQQQQQQQQQSQ